MTEKKSLLAKAETSFIEKWINRKPKKVFKVGDEVRTTANIHSGKMSLAVKTGSVGTVVTRYEQLVTLYEVEFNRASKIKKKLLSNISIVVDATEIERVE